MFGRAVLVSALGVAVATAGCGRLRFDPRDDGGDGDGSGDAYVDLCGFHAIDVGDRDTCAIDKNDAVWCWGANDDGIQLGGPPAVLTPVKKALPAGAVQIRVGGSSACARLIDGRVFCWGRNDDGQAGTGTPGSSTDPVLVNLGGDTAIDLDVGGNHACVRRASDGGVMCWGENKSFALANNGPATQATPTLVTSSAGAKSLALGHRHGCFIDNLDNPRCWGRQRTEGRLGNGGAADLQGPATITASPGSTAVAAGNRLTCTVATGGATRCFGERYLGGSGFDNYDAAPLVSDGVEVALGAHEGCARRTDGTVACWGYISIDGRTELTTTAVPFASLKNVTAIAGGWSHYCAIADGHAVCWGDNGGGALGRGFDNFVATPQVVPLPQAATQVASNGINACALAGGKVYCWGLSYSGEVGDGTTRASYSPREVAIGLTTIAGMTDGCAWGGGSVRCWGTDQDGQLGDNDTATPSTLKAPVTTQVSGALEVVTGRDFACARTATNVQCWGGGDYGRLGNGMASGLSATPVVVTGVTNPTALDSHGEASCAIASNQLRCWGRNDDAQLGDGTTMDRPTPVVIAIPNGAASVARGAIHTCAIDIGGDVYCWGANGDGQLGLGDTNIRMTPTKVTLPAAASTINAHDRGTCAKLVTGDVYCWGRGAEGQNANGTFDNASTPTLSPALAGASVLARSIYGGCAIISGQVLCWGHRMMLGDGDDSPTRPLLIAATCQ